MSRLTFGEVPVGEFFTTHPGGQFRGEVFKKIPVIAQDRNQTTREANAIALWEKHPNDTYFYHFADDLGVEITQVNGERRENFLLEI